MRAQKMPTPLPSRAAMLSIAALSGSSHLEGIIVTNVDLDLSGFTVSESNQSYLWDIDGEGESDLLIKIDGQQLFATSFQNGFSPRVSANSLLGPIPNLGQTAAVNTPFAEFKSNYVVGIINYGNFQNAVGFTSGESGYMGFKLNPSGSLVLYGWAEVVLTLNSGAGTFEVLRWAYEDSGTNITTPIPEPAMLPPGLGALALGVAGLRRWRKGKAV